MKRSVWLSTWLTGLTVLAGIVFGDIDSASGQQVLRIAKFTIADPGKQQEAFALTDQITEVFAKSEAFRWLKFSYDPETGENVAVSLWKDLSAMERSAQTEEFKALLEKMKQLTKGDFTAKTYQVYQPKKKQGRKKQ